MQRDIIEIDEVLCTGCGKCVPACHEGALQIIDNKARLISDLMCDGLGACLGQCPTGAMQVIQREATPYDERLVMVNIIQGGANVIQAHLQHMIDHDQSEYFTTAIEVLKEQGIPIPAYHHKKFKTIESNCPSQKEMHIPPSPSTQEKIGSGLNHWPIQLHLINPTSPNFSKANLLLASDCSAFAASDFHQTYLTGKKLAIACPKLDTNQDTYIEKLTLMIRYGKLKSITILRMEVPCCGGLTQLAQTAMRQAKCIIPIETITLNNKGMAVSL